MSSDGLMIKNLKCSVNLLNKDAASPANSRSEEPGTAVLNLNGEVSPNFQFSINSASTTYVNLQALNSKPSGSEMSSVSQELEARIVIPTPKIILGRDIPNSWKAVRTEKLFSSGVNQPAGFKTSSSLSSLNSDQFFSSALDRVVNSEVGNYIFPGSRKIS